MAENSVETEELVNYNKRLRQILLVLAMAMLLYLGLTFWAGFDRLWGAVRLFPLSSLILIFVLILVGWGLRALRWLYYSVHLKWEIPHLPNTLIFLSSFAFTATPGKAGEVVKSVLLHSRYGISISESAGVLLIERLQDLLAVLVLSAGGLVIFVDAWWYLLICSMMIFSLVLFIIYEPLHRGVFTFFSRISRLAPLMKKFNELLQTGKVLFQPLPFLVGFILALFAWTGEALALHWLFVGFKQEIPLFTSFFIYGLSTLIGALSMLPGGVGGFEAAMLFLLKTLHIPSTIAIASTVLIRALTLWALSILGMFFMFLWEVFLKNHSLTTIKKGLSFEEKK